MRELNLTEVENVDGGIMDIAAGFKAGFEAGVEFAQWLKSL